MRVVGALADMPEHAQTDRLNLEENKMQEFKLIVADGLLAFWDGQSRGTKQMIEYMRSLNKPVHIIHY